MKEIIIVSCGLVALIVALPKGLKFIAGWAFPKMEPLSLEEATEILKPKFHRRRDEAIDRLTELQAVAPLLDFVLKHYYVGSYDRAVQALGRLLKPGDARVVQRVLSVLTGSEHSLPTAQALKLLATFGDASALEPLVALARAKPPSSDCLSVVVALEAILRRDASKATNEGLEAVLALDNPSVLQPALTAHVDEDERDQEYAAIDCAELHQLAKSELARRAS